MARSEAMCYLPNIEPYRNQQFRDTSSDADTGRITTENNSCLLDHLFIWYSVLQYIYDASLRGLFVLYQTISTTPIICRTHSSPTDLKSTEAVF